MPKPRVVFINRVYPPLRGASGRVLRDLAHSFAKDGWQVQILTTGSKPGMEMDNQIQVKRVKGEEKPKGALAYFMIWLRLWKAMMKLKKSDLVVTMTDPPMLVVAGRLLQKFKGVRHVHWCHDLYPDILPALGVKVPWPFMGMLKRWTYKAMRSCDKVIVVGRCMAKILSEKGIEPTRITVIPNWPDHELVQNSNDNGGKAVQNVAGLNGKGKNVNGKAFAMKGVKAANDQLKLPPKFRVLYAGNIGRAHPIQTIIDAATILNEDNPEIEFVFVGEGPRFDMIAKERAKRRLENIRLLPYQPASQLRTVMESGDVHLISVKEAAAGLLVPSKLYSALAVGRPCIFVGPAQSETAKVITDFELGAVVSQGDPEGLAEQIREMRMNSDHWYKAHQGAVKASEIFVPHQAIQAWIERAHAVVQSKPKAS